MIDSKKSLVNNSKNKKDHSKTQLGIRKYM